jgi:ATP-binding cassette subfamily C protein
MMPLVAFLRLMRQAPRGQVWGLGVLTVVASATDGIGFVLLVPLLQRIGSTGPGGAGSGQGLSGELLNGLFDRVGTGTILLAFVGLVGLRSLVSHKRELLSLRVQNGLVDDMRQQTFSALLRAEWRWLVTQRHSDHASQLLTDINRVGMGLTFGIALIANLAAICAYLIVAFALSPGMAALVVVSGGLVFWVLARQRRAALVLGQDTTKANRAVQGNVQESLAAIKLSKILGSEQRHTDQLASVVEDLRANQMSFAANSAFSRGVFQFGGAALLASYIHIGLGYLHVPVVALLTLVLIFARLVPMFMQAQVQIHYWLNALPALQETERLLADCHAAAEPSARTEQPIWPVNTEIRLDGVSLTWNNRQRPALAEVSIRLAARTTTALMGHSGSGKSTLADVVMGLLTPDSGVVSVDGVAVEGSLRQRWRGSVAYVPQDSHLFHASIRENLLWAKATATDDDMKRSLEQASAEFVFELPDGLDTQVGDGGSRLSGGERQRIALSRALLQSPSLLILDEATSALDTASEARIREAIERLHGDVTVLIIGHRLPTLEHADQVIRLDQGRVVAQGSWAEVNSWT